MAIERLPSRNPEKGLIKNPEVESTNPEKFPKKKNLIFKHYKDVIAALGYVGGSVYLAFKHKEFSDAAITTIAYTVATVAAAMSLEDRRIAK